MGGQETNALTDYTLKVEIVILINTQNLLTEVYSYRDTVVESITNAFPYQNRF